MAVRIATIGFFDGVHAGHRYLFEQLRAVGAQRSLVPTIYTFREHPACLLKGQCPPLLTTASERLQLLEQEGELRVMDFRDVQQLTAAAFLRRLAADGVVVLLMGYDHRFGSDCLTDYEDYRRLGAAVGIEVLRAAELTGQEHVSSSALRHALQQGDMERLMRGLGYAYSLTGEVVHGNGIGRRIGFPTANVQTAPEKALPQAGVYVGELALRGECFRALVNIGTNPTVGNASLTVEAYLPKFEGDAFYGEQVTIRLLRRLRAEQKFASLASLQAQIRQDLSALE